MASTSVLVLTLLVLFALLHTGTSIKCYACDKVVDELCDDPFSEEAKTKFEKQCETNQTHCLKVVQPYDGDAYIRKCGVEADCNLFTECYTCKKELCNSSSSIAPSFLIISILSAVLAKYYL